MTGSMPQIPVSWGELIDKITILEIKVERLETKRARANAVKELEMLHKIAAAALVEARISVLVARLRLLNEALWDIEDSIRDQERIGAFGPIFIELARSVYLRNDERGAIKRKINLVLDSALVEEKFYKKY